MMRISWKRALTNAICILYIISTVAPLCSAQHNDICGQENTTFSKGEILKYKLYYNLSFIWIPAGEAIFEMSETDTTYEARVTGRSYGSYDNIFKVRDEYYSSIDKEHLHPRTFVRKVEEGDHLRYDSISFDYRDSLVYSYNGLTRATADWDTFDLASCTQDLVSIMYNLRNIKTDDYSKGDNIQAQLFFDKEYVPVDITYLKKERKKVKNLGKYNTIKIKPEVIIGSVFKEGDIMHVWVSDDQNKIPLQIESPILIGKVKAILTEHKGLSHPLKTVDQL